MAVCVCVWCAFDSSPCCGDIWRPGEAAGWMNGRRETSQQTLQRCVRVSERAGGYLLWFHMIRKSFRVRDIISLRRLHSDRLHDGFFRMSSDKRKVTGKESKKKPHALMATLTISTPTSLQSFTDTDRRVKWKFHRRPWAPAHHLLGFTHSISNRTERGTVMLAHWSKHQHRSGTAIGSASEQWATFRGEIVICGTRGRARKNRIEFEVKWSEVTYAPGSSTSREENKTAKVACDGQSMCPKSIA